MREIKIIVASETGNGKSTIANQIVNILRCSGLDVDLIDRDSPEHPPSPRMSIHRCAEAFAHMVANKEHHITVETRQVKRLSNLDGPALELRDMLAKKEYTNAISCDCDGSCKRGVKGN